MINKTIIKKKKQTRKLPKAIHSEEFIELIKVIPKKDMIARISFLLAYGSGMCISEILRCQKEHFRSNSIFIPLSKYGVKRVVPIPKGWEETFLEHLPIKRTARSLQKKFKTYCKKANLNPAYTPNSLCYGFIVNSLEKGIPANQVQILFGRSSILIKKFFTKTNPLDALKSYEDLF